MGGRVHVHDFPCLFGVVSIRQCLAECAGASAETRYTHLARVNRNITGGASELSLLEDDLDVLRAGWPGWGVITQTEGKQWPETEPQEHDSVYAFITWCQRVGASNVSKRVKYGKTVQDQERRRLVTDFEDKRKAYSTTISQRDIAVRDAKKKRLAGEEPSEL